VRSDLCEGSYDRRDKSGFGALARGALGYALCKTASGGSGRQIAKTAGAVGGAVVGSVAEEKMTF